MQPIHKTTPKDVFSHLFAIVTLYAGVISFIALIFEYIEKTFPDQLIWYDDSFHSIRNSLAVLIVVWPVYVLISWIIGKDMRVSPEKREIGIRRWLHYLTLFIAAITIIIDLITLINNFLEGDLTTRFVLKVLVVLITVGSVFAYYLWDVRRTQESLSSSPRKLALIVSALLLISIVGGFFIIGSPAKQRLIRFDERRVSDLQTLQYEIINYWQKKGDLPQTFDDLKNDITGFTSPRDPETGEPYNYAITVKGGLTFELCATFKTANDAPEAGLPKMRAPRAPIKPPVEGENWLHSSGQVCFTRIIDPELYKPIPSEKTIEAIPPRVIP